MTHNVQILNSVLTILGFATLVGFLYGPWQRLVVDIIRQQLFEIRDTAFDFAAKGEVEFNSGEYIFFRELINSMIRNAHTATFWRHIVYGLFIRKVTDKKSTQKSNVFKNPTLKRNFDKALTWTILLLWLRSPFLIIITTILILPLPLLLLMAAISVKIRQQPKRLAANLKHQIQRDVVVSVSQEDAHGYMYAL